MNLLQNFMAAANAQARAIVQEAFTIAGDATVYFGTFGDPVMMPIMTPTGYQDHLVIPLKAEAIQFVTPLPEKFELVRTQTSRTLFCQMVDDTAVVVFTFILTDRVL